MIATVGLGGMGWKHDLKHYDFVQGGLMFRHGHGPHIQLCFRSVSNGATH